MKPSVSPAELTDALRQLARTLDVGGTSLSTTIAVGITGWPKRNLSQWYPVTITGGRCLIGDPLEIDSRTHVDVSWKHSMAIAGKASLWSEAVEAGLDSFLAAVLGSGFHITGDLPLFIRHMETIVALLSSLTPLSALKRNPDGSTGPMADEMQ